MAKVTVRQEEHVFSHGKPARGKGTWAFTVNRNDTVDHVFWSDYCTVAQGAKAAAAHFGVSQVWVQP